MAELVLEIFSEEIPARMQLNACEKLKQNFTDALKKTGLYYQNCEAYVTPRRLVITIAGLSLTQEDVVTERRGPRTDAPDGAIQGFLRSTGLDKSQLTVKSSERGDFYFAITTQKGKPTKEILKDIVETILSDFTWPKSMRWGEGKIRWVRPIQNILCIFGGDILPIKFGNLVANNLSYGHRFLSSKEFKVTAFEQYKKELKERFVVLNHKDRRLQILFEAEKLAAKNNLKLIEDPKLLDEVTGLVEYPVVLEGNIEKNFMKLPEEVLITTIKINQKYFCLRDEKGKLSNKFIFVSNIKTTSNNKEVIEGNQRVIRSRLKDAEFFYDQDKKQGLESFSDNLEKIIFHKEIGTIASRVKRIEKLAVILADILGFKKPEVLLVRSAANLIKNDLTTEMVGEFPELQGIMGYYYALEQGEDIKVANAIKSQYKPQGPNDEIPTEAISVVISLAEKIESLACLYVAGERATGSKDPYALRRAALGVLRILDKNEISIDLRDVVKRTLKLVENKFFKKQKRDELLEEISDFILDRIKFQLKAEGAKPEIINTCLSRDEVIDFVDYKDTIRILTLFAESEEGNEAIEAYKRAKNILDIEEKKEGRNFITRYSESLLKTQVEIELSDALKAAKANITKLAKKGDFPNCLFELTKLSNKVNSFYDHTTINIEDAKLRENRLKLTASIAEIFEFLVEFSLI